MFVGDYMKCPQAVIARVRDRERVISVYFTLVSFTNCLNSGVSAYRGITARRDMTVFS